MQQRQFVPLIFCERNGQWAAAWRIAWDRRLRRGEPAAEIRVRQTRSPAECLEAIEAAPAAFVLVELTAANCDRMLDLLFEISSRHRCAAAAAVAADRSLRDFELAARELGALHFLVSPRELPGLAALVERFAARAPQGELEFEDRVWASLPWAVYNGA